LTKLSLAPSLATMFMRLYDQSLMRRVMAVVATLFAMQLLLSSACMMAEAAPMSETAATHMHMDHHAKTAPAPHHKQQQNCCSYQQSKQAVSASLVWSLDVPSFVLNTKVRHEPVLFSSASFAMAHMPTGPPRSSSLLFSTTQRIRI